MVESTNRKRIPARVTLGDLLRLAIPGPRGRYCARARAPFKPVTLSSSATPLGGAREPAGSVVQVECILQDSPPLRKLPPFLVLCLFFLAFFARRVARVFRRTRAQRPPPMRAGGRSVSPATNGGGGAEAKEEATTELRKSRTRLRGCEGSFAASSLVLPGGASGERSDGAAGWGHQRGGDLATGICNELDTQGSRGDGHGGAEDRRAAPRGVAQGPADGFQNPGLRGWLERGAKGLLDSGSRWRSSTAEREIGISSAIVGNPTDRRVARLTRGISSTSIFSPQNSALVYFCISKLMMWNGNSIPFHFLPLEACYSTS